MRVVHSSYGSSVFDVKREVEESKKKLIKLSIYFIMTGIVFYSIQAIFQISSFFIMDMMKSALYGRQFSFDRTYFENILSNENTIGTFIVSTVVFFEGVAVYIKDIVEDITNKFNGISQTINTKLEN